MKITDLFIPKKKLKKQTKRFRQRHARHKRMVCKIAAMYRIPVHNMDETIIGNHFGLKGKPNKR